MTKVAGSETTGSVSPTIDAKKKKSVWSDVPRRLATICVGIPFVWKLLERPVTAYVFFFGAHALSVWEYSLLEPAIVTAGSDERQSLSKRSRFLFCASSLVLAAIPDSLSSIFSFAVSLAAGIFAMANKHHWIIGLLVVTLPFRSWCNLSYYSDPSSFSSTVAVLLTVWNADTGALVAGRLLGRRKAADSNKLPSWIRRISPAKTMEGFLGGILGGSLTALWAIPMLLNAFSMATSPGFCKLWGLDSSINDEGSVTLSSVSSLNRLLLGFCLSVLAILGDLVESSVKRRSQSKDSGSVLPGHGGILDRFDSSLLAVLFYRVALEQATAMVNIGNDAYSDTQQGNIEL